MSHFKYLSIFLMLNLIACEDKSPSNSNRFNENCVRKLSEKISTGNPSLSPQLRREMAESGCTQVKDQCEKDPGGVICSKMKEEFSN